jgi:hypothetical protein
MKPGTAESGESAGGADFAGPVLSARQRRLCRLFGVHEYPDVFERFVRLPLIGDVLARHLRGGKCNVVFRANVIFIHVPKNAGTSIANAIYGDSIGHRTALFYKKFAPDFFQHVRKFAVLRDPLERFLSAYWYVRAGGGTEVRMDPVFYTRVSHIDSVDALLDYLEERLSNIFGLDHVLRPQCWYLADEKGEILIDELYVLDGADGALNQAIADLSGKSLPRMNTTSRGSEALSPAQISRIERLYKRDFELFRSVQMRQSA